MFIYRGGAIASCSIGGASPAKSLLLLGKVAGIGREVAATTHRSTLSGSLLPQAMRPDQSHTHTLRLRLSLPRKEVHAIFYATGAQAEIAARFRVSQPTVSRIKHGLNVYSPAWISPVGKAAE